MAGYDVSFVVCVGVASVCRLDGAAISLLYGTWGRGTCLAMLQGSGGGGGGNRIVYSDLVGYQTSDIRLLWTIITKP